MAQAVVGALRVNLGADTAAFSTGMRTATRDLQGFGRAASSVGGRSRAFGGQMQNLGFQVQDVAVQITSGTSALQAFGQQLPQLLGGFGAAGAAFGAIAAVGLGLAVALNRSRETAVTADAAITGLTGAMNEAKEASDLLKQSQGELSRQFGSVATGASLAAGQARDALDTVTASVRALGSTPEFTAFTGQLDAARAILAEVSPLAAKAGDDIRELAFAFDLPESMAADLVARMDEFRAATTAPEMAQALLGIYQRLRDAKTEMGELPPEAEALRAALSGAVGQLGAAIAQTNELSGALSAAADQAARLANERRLARQEDKRENVARDIARDTIAGLATTEDDRRANRRGVTLSYQDRLGLPASDPRSPGFRNYTLLKGGGGGGGAAKVSDEAKALTASLEKLDQAAQQVFAETRTPQERFGERMMELNGLVSSGRITMETYSRAVEQAQDALAGAGETGSDAFRNLADDAGDMVAGVVQGTTTIKDSFRSLFAQISGDLITSGVRGLLGGLFKGGGAGGGIFGGVGKALGIPGFANGTSFAPGGLAMVGERGPELVNLPRGSRVTPNHALGGAMRVTFAVDADASGNLLPFVTEVSRGEVARAAPSIVGESVKASGNAMAGNRRFGRPSR